MKHLSGLDATFLHIESPEMPMHIGSLHVMDLPPGYSGDFFEDAKKCVAERLHLAEVFTRKLALMPFDLSNPVWVDDEDIDLDYHIRHISLPKPGTNRQLQQYVARLHSTLLDRSRPLWEFFVIDGLKSGQVGLYCKVHHAGIDGQAGVAVAKALFDLEPTGRVIKPPRPKARRNEYHLGIAEMASAALGNAGREYLKLIRMAPGIVRALRDVVVPEKDENGKRQWGLPKDLKIFGPRTMLNVAITNQRTFAGRTIPLSESKAIARSFGVTLNDVVMATTAGALRRYLKSYEDLPVKPLIAAVPVSLRAAGDESANNQVSMLANTLATDVADPVERLRTIHAAATSNKAMMGRMKTSIPTDFPMLGAPWLVSGLAALFGRSRLANVMPPVANLVISNVQGIPVPLYFAGARMACYYPVSIPSHSMALNVTVQSYNGRMDYGLIACRRAVPDINDLGDALLAEHQILMAKATEHDAEKAQKAAEAAKAAEEDAAKAAKAKPARKPARKSAQAPATTPVAAPARKAARPAARKLALVSDAAVIAETPAVKAAAPARKRTSSAARRKVA